MSTHIPGEDVGAAVEALEGADVVGPWGEHDAQSLAGIEGVGSLAVLRRGLAASPELRSGLLLTAAMALAVAAGKLLIPLTIQMVLDRGVFDGDIQMGVVVALTGVAAGLVAIGISLERITYLRLTRTAEDVLYGLRVRTFAHLQRLSLAEHTASRTGVLTARVTSDVEALNKFAQWGAVAWIISAVQIVAVLVIMLVFSWQLALVTLLVHVPLLPVLRSVQRGQLRAYDRLRTRVSETLARVSESVLGMDVIRAYGQREVNRGDLHEAVDQQYRQQMRAMRYFSLVLPLTDVVGMAAIATVIATGVWWGDAWGVSAGELVAFMFLANLFVAPITQLGEVLDQTQTALAGWWKILDVLDTEPDLVDPGQGLPLPEGSLGVRAEGLEFRYREGGLVLHGIDVVIPPGASVAVVGETGSGKTTFAKLVARLADPTAGRLLVGGVDLRQVKAADRRSAVRMVPQDGFLFDTTVCENVRYGRPGATAVDAVAAFVSLGLDEWVASLPAGIDTPVGERGESLSVGERQLVALARAHLADPGLLILDEATSAVDPETEQALEQALARLSEGRTTISIAHRLSTAERADLVFVFDDGHVVERGRHADLAAAGGVYSGLHESWLGSTRDR
ncbi:MAG TPA: ABC transporter ATP-binding protein [Acidimicrobiaceae bacterium]|nr:multidrug ABC transporter ATP-binding protein [Acidimicrobiaceae bacterium]HBM55863.1 ABC transporter ATP-binding protein [Acidimicrobiaceae bacterium]